MGKGPVGKPRGKHEGSKTGRGWSFKGGKQGVETQQGQRAFLSGILGSLFRSGHRFVTQPLESHVTFLPAICPQEPGM